MFVELVDSYIDAVRWWILELLLQLFANIFYDNVFIYFHSNLTPCSKARHAILRLHWQWPNDLLILHQFNVHFFFCRLIQSHKNICKMGRYRPDGTRCINSNQNKCRIFHFNQPLTHHDFSPFPNLINKIILRMLWWKRSITVSHIHLIRMATNEMHTRMLFRPFYVNVKS